VLPQIFTVDAGETHSVMIAGDGSPWAVGRNQSGQLCSGTLDPSATYVPMVGLPVGRKAVQVRAGSLMTAVLDDSGTLRGCGAAGSVNLGNTLAVLPGIPDGHRVTDVAVGFAHVVALVDDGRVFGLGRGTEGQLSGSQDQASFVQIGGLFPGITVVDVAAGGHFTLILDSLGEIYGTGLNTTGQLGVLASPVTMLTKIGGQPAGVEVVQIGAGNGHALMLGSNGFAYAQGSNTEGQLGNGTNGGFSDRWSRMRSASDLVWIDGGTVSTVAITQSGTPLTTGSNADGQQGLPVASLVRNTELTEFGTDYLDFPSAAYSDLVAGGSSVVGRDREGFLFGSGKNEYSQIRSFDTDDVESLRRMPHQVVRGTGGAQVTGTRKVGQKLTADPGRWTPSANMTFQYGWKRDGVVVQQASSAAYVLVADDIGRRISVQVTSNLPSSNNSSSAPVGVAIPGINKTRPTISGTAKVGRLLRATKGTWTAPGYTFRYQWLRNGKAISGATRSTYRSTKSDRSKKIGVQVRGTRSGFASITAASSTRKVFRSR